MECPLQLKPRRADLLCLPLCAAHQPVHPRCGLQPACAPGLPSAHVPRAPAPAGWALAAMDELTPELWAAVNAYISRCPPEALDEVNQCGN